MTKMLKARKGGFTLIELLIVIMIISILAGMMMLSMGSATDLAEAAKVINDLRATKAAAVLLYVDQGPSWAWVASNEATPTNVEASMDTYLDRPMFTTNTDYGLLLQSEVPITIGGTGGTSVTKDLIGITVTGMAAGVQQKLAERAVESGLYNATGAAYTTGTSVYMMLR